MNSIVIERVASCKSDKCIRTLCNILERQYKNIEFDLHIGHTSTIEANSVPITKDEWREIVHYCDGFIDGWGSYEPDDEWNND